MSSTNIFKYMNAKQANTFRYQIEVINVDYEQKLHAQRRKLYCKLNVCTHTHVSFELRLNLTARKTSYYKQFLDQQRVIEAEKQQVLFGFMQDARERYCAKVIISVKKIIPENFLFDSTLRQQHNIYHQQQQNLYRNQSLAQKDLTKANDQFDRRQLLNVKVEKLKRMIFRDISKDLPVHLMQLRLNQTILQDNQTLAHYKWQPGANVVKQERVSLASVKGLPFRNGLDPITEEEGVVSLRCGHVFGQSSMRQFIKNELRMGKNKLRCTHLTLDQRCDSLIDINLAKKIGVLTNSEAEAVETQISYNLILMKSNLCSNCGGRIMKDTCTRKTSKVQCPYCLKNICLDCGDQWQLNSLSLSCQSEKCKHQRQTLKHCPMDRMFNLWHYTEKGEKAYQKMWTPKFRSCPACKEIVQNFAQCKHSKCPKRSCRTEFCWICLRVKYGENWSQNCGQTYEKCQLAGRQVP